MRLQLVRPPCEEASENGCSSPQRCASLAPAFQALHRAFEATRQREIERHAGRFNEASREDLDRLTRAILQRVLAVPAARLEETRPARAHPERDAALLARLFTHPSAGDALEPEALTRCCTGDSPVPGPASRRLEEAA